MAPRLTLLVLSFAGLAAADITGLQPGTTTFTLSSSFSYDAPNVVEAAARIDLYETRLTARMAGGPYLFDQIFAVPYGDPGVQIGVANALLALGSPALVTGSLVSSLTSLQGTDVTSSDSAPVTIGTYINFSPLIGPGSVRIGDFQKPSGYPEASPVPEPSTLAVVAAGLAGIGWWRRRS